MHSDESKTKTMFSAYNYGASVAKAIASIAPVTEQSIPRLIIQ
ncbi:hypothetical protein N836_18670 [Leptolyngbya sp. Heron Island J]|nr:hypothetical protein N836_18670 [Leptolyngbya sp. Heron Island J]